tara:strand:- start:290 stop:583 length:294 start_codon:yes stop_codon:yes gene_type:complete
MIKTLLKIISKEQYGFVLSDDLTVLEKEMPRMHLLMRFGACREVAEASAVKTIISEKEAAGDYIRDVSIPARVLDRMYEGWNGTPFEVRRAIAELRA